MSPSDELRSAVGQERLDTLLVVGRLEDDPCAVASSRWARSKDFSSPSESVARVSEGNGRPIGDTADGRLDFGLERLGVVDVVEQAQSAARLASRISPVNTSSFATFVPTTRGSRYDVPASTLRPTCRNTKPMLADSLASWMSLTIARFAPAPTADPSTFATVGTGSATTLAMVSRVRRASSLTASSVGSSFVSRSLIPSMSPPAENDSPVPSMTTHEHRTQSRWYRGGAPGVVYGLCECVPRFRFVQRQRSDAVGEDSSTARQWFFRCRAGSLHWFRYKSSWYSLQTALATNCGWHVEVTTASSAVLTYQCVLHGVCLVQLTRRSDRFSGAHRSVPRQRGRLADTSGETALHIAEYAERVRKLDSALEQAVCDRGDQSPDDAWIGHGPSDSRVRPVGWTGSTRINLLLPDEHIQHIDRRRGDPPSKPSLLENEVAYDEEALNPSSIRRDG